MSLRQHENNYVLGFVSVIVIAIAALWMDWGSFQSVPSAGDFMRVDLYDAISPFTSGHIVLDGFNGWTTIAGIRIPDWVIPALIATAALIGILQVKHVISVSRVIPLIMSLVATALSLLFVYLFSNFGTVMIGAIAVLLCASVTIYLVATMPLRPTENDEVPLGREKDTAH